MNDAIKLEGDRSFDDCFWESKFKEFSIKRLTGSSAKLKTLRPSKEQQSGQISILRPSKQRINEKRLNWS